MTLSRHSILYRYDRRMISERVAPVVAPVMLITVCVLLALAIGFIAGSEVNTPDTTVHEQLLNR